MSITAVGAGTEPPAPVIAPNRPPSTSRVPAGLAARPSTRDGVVTENEKANAGFTLPVAASSWASVPTGWAPIVLKSPPTNSRPPTSTSSSTLLFAPCETKVRTTEQSDSLIRATRPRLKTAPSAVVIVVNRPPT